VIIHPVQIRGAEYVGIDTNPWGAVWVTPNMDSITSIHKDLSSRLPDGKVLGYQKYSGKTLEESVSMQVQAIYEMIASKGISYVNNPDAGVQGKIKYPVEVLRTHQANCIEASYLFASILESIGLQPFIVFIRHMLLLAGELLKTEIRLIFLKHFGLGGISCHLRESECFGYRKNIRLR
jgi:hypothetical protein